MPEHNGTWTDTFRVRAYETDVYGVASVQTLCNYFQEAAGWHARALGVSMEALQAQRLTWVLARLHVQIDAYPAWGQEVVVETWPSGIQGPYATRDFLFLGAAPGATERPVIGRGTSAWLIVDIARKRPVRATPYLHDVKPPDRARALNDPFDKMTAPQTIDYELDFRVRYSDLDVNRHVNNVCYAEWIVESVPEDVLHACRLQALEIQFRAEATLGHTVVVQTRYDAHGNAPAFTHRLARRQDDRDVVLARTRWVMR